VFFILCWFFLNFCVRVGTWREENFQRLTTWGGGARVWQPGMQFKRRGCVLNFCVTGQFNGYSYSGFASCDFYLMLCYFWGMTCTLRDRVEAQRGSGERGVVYFSEMLKRSWPSRFQLKVQRSVSRTRTNFVRQGGLSAEWPGNFFGAL
jgi:hypothetical protein